MLILRMGRRFGICHLPQWPRLVCRQKAYIAQSRNQWPDSGICSGAALCRYPKSEQLPELTRHRVSFPIAPGRPRPAGPAPSWVGMVFIPVPPYLAASLGGLFLSGIASVLTTIGGLGQCSGGAETRLLAVELGKSDLWYLSALTGEELEIRLGCAIAQILAGPAGGPPAGPAIHRRPICRRIAMARWPCMSTRSVELMGLRSTAEEWDSYRGPSRDRARR